MKCTLLSSLKQLLAQLIVKTIYYRNPWVAGGGLFAGFKNYFLRKLKSLSPLDPNFILRKDKRPCLGIVAIAKNEAPYIREWIEFHRMIGAERIFLYDNESTDNLREILEPYIQSGLVSYKFWPGTKQQQTAYIDCFKTAYRHVKWLAVIDIDEFLCPIQHDSIPDYLATLIQKIGYKPDSISINWVTHGYNGHKTKPHGLVTECYPKCTYNPENQQCKSIVKTDSVIDSVSPHFHVCFPTARYVFSDGSLYRKGRTHPPFISSPEKFSHIVCHHYFTKSYEEWSQKRLRGRFTSGGNYNLVPFDPVFCSSDTDSSMPRFLPKLKQRLANPQQPQS